MVLVVVEVHVPVAEVPVSVVDGIVDGLQGLFDGVVAISIPAVHAQANFEQGIERTCVGQDVVDLVAVAGQVSMAWSISALEGISCGHQLMPSVR